MTQLITFFLQLSLLRQPPQHLPASKALLGVVFLLNVLMGWVGTISYFQKVEVALMASLTDALLLGLMVWVTLWLLKLPMRFVQAITACYGLGVLFSVLTLPLHLFINMFDMLLLAALLQLVALGWIHVALGHVLRHSMNLALWNGIVLATGYTLISLNVISLLFPLEPGSAGTP